MSHTKSTTARGIPIEVGSVWFERTTQGREVVVVNGIWNRTVLFERSYLSVGDPAESRIGKRGARCGRVEFVSYYEPVGYDEDSLKEPKP